MATTRQWLRREQGRHAPADGPDRSRRSDSVPTRGSSRQRCNVTAELTLLSSPSWAGTFTR